MKRNYWFVARKYGYGWTPATWQGWSIVGLYIATVIFLLLSIDRDSPSVLSTILHFFPNIVGLTVILIVICYVTGEKPHWRWGNKK